MAEVDAGGLRRTHVLPRRFPLRAANGPDGSVYLAYGPHQSYWPTVYIWGARNGVLAIDPEDLSLHDRRIPRQPLDLALDDDGVLWLPQNNWGRERQFLLPLRDAVREPVIDERLETPDEVERETTQRVLRWDSGTQRLYLARIGETDDAPSVLQVIDPEARAADAEAPVVERRIELGPGATDLVFDDRRIYVSSFDADAVAVIDKATWEVETVATGDGPLRLCRLGDRIFVLDHVDRRVEEIGGAGRSWTLPLEGRGDELLSWNGRLVAVGHDPDRMVVFLIDPDADGVAVALEHAYPYGDTRFDTRNSAFYVGGQYGDGVLTLTRARPAADGSLWLADFLAGRVFVLGGATVAPRQSAP